MDVNAVIKFLSVPSQEDLCAFTKAQLFNVAKHYKLHVITSMTKSEVRNILVKYLVYKELLPRSAFELLETEASKIKELGNKYKVQSVKIKEQKTKSEIRIKELELQIQKQDIENKMHYSYVIRNIGFVPHFRENDVAAYFPRFEKVAQQCKWPVESWTMFLLNGLVGKARAVYKSLTVEQIADYQLVKAAILQAYKLVPEQYHRQQFRDCKKKEGQTYAEFGREKEKLFDRWYHSEHDDKAFNAGNLKELVLVEEFKRCIHADVATYLDDRKVATLVEAVQHSFNQSLHPSP